MDRNTAVLNLCWKQMDLGSRICLLLAAVVAIMAVGQMLGGPATLDNSRMGWFVFVVGMLLEGALVRPLLQLASQGSDRIWPVCALSCLALGVFLIAFYWTYFCFAGNLESGSVGSPVSKILDLPPLLAAIWAASTGWYVHFQLTGRNHRVAHSMSLVMGTRTSAEYLMRHDLIREMLPTAADIAALDQKFFRKNALKDAKATLTDASAALRALPRDAAERLAAIERKRVAAIELKTAEAVNALQYVLNYYEFMAAGIRYGELDERLFYETISPAVLGLCERAEPYLKWMNDPAEGGQQFAFEYLKPLVQKWKQMTDKESAEAEMRAAEERRARAVKGN